MADKLIRDFDDSLEFVLGDAQGRVKLVWYIDYTCHHTRRVRDLLRRSVDRFGQQDAGLAIRFAPSSERASQSVLACQAAIAAGWQGKFLEMHVALFETVEGYAESNLLQCAVDCGLDSTQFQADLRSERTLARLQEHRAAAAQQNVNATPALFVDGRRYTDAWDELSLIEAIQKPLGYRLKLASTDFFHWAASAGLVLVLATVAALVVANTGFHAPYEHLRETPLSLGFGDRLFSESLEIWINDGLMAVFFLLVGIEIKREIVNGELSDMSRAALPILGAVGGMAVPALIYAAINFGGTAAHGWGVPMATDIAFTLGIMALLGDRVPASLKVFISALAIADDLGAIIVIALFYGHGFDPVSLMVAGVILAVLFGLNRARIYARTPYIIMGIVLWYFVFESGLHATLAGVLTAAMIPSRPSANLAGMAAQAEAVFEAEMRAADNDRPDIDAATFGRLEDSLDRLVEPGFRLQHALERWSNFLILPLFAFFNTGILIFGSSFSLFAPEALGVIAGLMIGKPLGIVLLCWVAVRLGLGRLSSEVSWTQMIGAGCLAGVGFTMSIFIGSAAFHGAQLETVKLSILLASILSACIGSFILYRAGQGATA